MSIENEQNGKSSVTLAIRVALLEALTFGTVSDPASYVGISEHDASSHAGSKTAPGTLASQEQSLAVRAAEAQKKLLESVERYKPIVKFVENYQANQAYLLPAQQQQPSQTGLPADAAKSGSQDPSSSLAHDVVSPQSVIALVLDAEQDVKQLERDLRSLETFVQRDVAGAGNLRSFESLVPRVNELKAHVAKRLEVEHEAEGKAMAVMQTYNEHIDAQSKLFIHWDSMLTSIEDALRRLERGNR